VTISEAQLTWVDTDFLREHEVRPWMDMPVWMEPTTEMAGFSTYDISKAISAGLTFRPLADTARDTLEWWNARPEEERSLRFGIAPEKEAAVLEAWHGRTG
jgi:2'-hydroxyisoflavone reductase